MATLKATSFQSAKYDYLTDGTIGDQRDSGGVSRTNIYLSSNSGALKASKHYFKETTLNASANTSFNFAALPGPFLGETFNISKTRFFRIEVTSGAIAISTPQATFAALSHTSGADLDADPMGVTMISGEIWTAESATTNGMNTTNGTMTITNSSNSANCTVRVVIWGE